MTGVVLSVLIDSGSTHNFVQVAAARRLKWPISPIQQFKVVIGSGDKLCCNKICKNVELVVQGTHISVDLFLLPMDDIDVVLGIQWLKTLGKITTDYSDLSMEFHYKDQQVSWTGEAWIEDSSLSARELKKLSNFQHRAYLCRFQAVCEKPIEQNSLMQELSLGTTELLNHHKSLFEEPSELPQQRIQDHRIHLVENTNPVNVRPYRCP